MFILTCVWSLRSSGNVMDCHAMVQGSISGRNGVFIDLHILRKGQQMGVPSLNDLAVDGTLNTTNQPYPDLNLTCLGHSDK